ncbi:MAG: endonuclease [Candidatus Brocadia sp.]|jgi:endonuclease-3 related protein|uniref:Glycosylase n=1 Tax=Candidatus Brocadia fulgida TaxID=380242 RepID=A0A0M2UXZ1_9BACT|nr:MAG: putative glycosylase [Candidatus Brocadia fulgida]MCC6324611.1 endonuclease III domain-containing protein [Candidatus Brocadia sp.]MCE7910301.1 endonuclease III domain-containing protein [Candidatus Brocadia sp. AMX3]OQZ00484.1 MAG: endonuclease [Candidatus Brocadia sp. UTAMX2]MBV6519595.1 Ultraviolet N-glycosylase/AP lyase [Candidatus Brocadia fulgida]
MNKAKAILQIYQTMLDTLGPQQWWPGETPFEIVIGAILTQNTNWSNVEKAIRNLKTAGKLSPRGIHELSMLELAQLIRPSGFFNVKAKRVKAFINWLFSRYEGNLSRMFNQDLQILRDELLSVKGIGPETADSILLYAGNMPTFVVDAYTHRIFSRHGFIAEESTYDEMKAFFEENLPKDVTLYNEYHALLVHIGKRYCRPKKACEPCPLKDFL